MSADDYFVIHQHPLGGYAAVRAFESDNKQPKPSPTHHQFATIGEALEYAESEYPEYGVSFSGEVRELIRLGAK